MTNKNLIAILFIAITILLSGCKKSALLTPDANVSENSNEVSQSDASTYHSIVDLMAGQHLYKVGVVEITDLKNGSLEVKYSVGRQWKLQSISLFMGEFYEIPLNRSGECITEEFPYKQTFKERSAITSATFLIQKTKIPKLGVVVANAKIINLQIPSTIIDAWAKGTRITKNNVAMYYTYNLLNIGPAVKEEFLD